MISRKSFNGAYPIKRLGEVVEFLDYKRRPVAESERRSGKYPYYGANGIQGTIDEFIFDEPLVLLAEDGGHFGEPDRGIAYRISGKTWVNNHAHVLRPTSQIDLSYLCRVLENYDVTPFVTGTTRGKLTKAGASEITIPLPPLSGQRRIAEVLDRADALRAKRRAALAQLDSLTQSLFLDLFGDPVFNPKKIPKRPLGELIRVKSGDSVLISELSDSGEFPVYGGNGINGYHTRYMFESSHIVIGRVGVYCGVVHITKPRAWVTDNALFVTGISPEIEIPYLAQALTIANLNQYAGRAAQPLVSGSRIYPVEILVPPIPLQREFDRRVTAVEALKTAHRASLAELDALFASLQHRAFKGEL